MELLPALVAKRNLLEPIRLFGADSPRVLPRTRPFAVSSKPPLPVPPVANEPPGVSIPSFSRLKTTTRFPVGSFDIV